MAERRGVIISLEGDFGTGDIMQQTRVPFMQILRNEGIAPVYVENVVFSRLDYKGIRQALERPLCSALDAFKQQLVDLANVTDRKIRPAQRGSRGAVIKHYLLDIRAAARAMLTGNAEQFRTQINEASRGIEPDLICFFDLNPEIGFQNLKKWIRVKKDGKEIEPPLYITYCKDSMQWVEAEEKLVIANFYAMHQAYRDELKLIPKEKLLILDANETAEVLYRKILANTSSFFKRP